MNNENEKFFLSINSLDNIIILNQFKTNKIDKYIITDIQNDKILLSKETPNYFNNNVENKENKIENLLKEEYIEEFLSNDEDYSNEIHISNNLEKTDKKINLKNEININDNINSCIEIKNDNKICIICYKNFEKFQKIIKINKCIHFYHYNCIFLWIVQKGENYCPICKNN